MLYLGESLEVCFLEAVLRDRRDGQVGMLVLEERELEERRYAQIEVTTPLRLVDLRGNRPVAMGVPTDVHRSKRHASGQRWSLAFYTHPAAPDGVIYSSRLNGQVNLAIYDRAVPTLQVLRVRRLIDVPELGPVLDDLDVAIVEPDPPGSRESTRD